MKGIKETKELIEGLGEAASSGRKIVKVIKNIFEDGLSASDIIYLQQLFESFPDMDIIQKGIDGADEALEEMKNLDQLEVVELIADLYKQAERFRDS